MDPNTELDDPDLVPRGQRSDELNGTSSDAELNGALNGTLDRELNATLDPPGEVSSSQELGSGGKSATKRRKPNQPNILKPIPDIPLADKPLNARQRLFVIEYAKDGNGKRAALASGSTEKGAAAQAQKYLNPNGKFPHVAKACRLEFEEKRKEAKIDAQQIVQELGRVAFFNPKRLLDDDGALVNLRQMPDEVAVAIKKLRVTYRVGVDDSGEPAKVRITEIEFWNKLEALKQLAQHLGLLKESAATVNVLTLDWAGLMGRRPLPLPSSDPVEARIAAMEQSVPLLEHVNAAPRQPVSVAVPGDVLDQSKQVQEDTQEVDVSSKPPTGLEN